MANEGVSVLIVDEHEHLATLNLDQGKSLYGERLINVQGHEFRLWDPFRSKLAAALTKGLDIDLKPNTRVLYLGASTGTTVSHISDIVGTNGRIFAVESSSRVGRELIANVSSRRNNVIPIITDARKPRSYFSIYDTIDMVYCDIAQPDQTEIAIDNCHVYLKHGGVLLLVIKTRSIDVTMDPRKVVKREIRKLEYDNFKNLQVVNLDPFDKDHAFVYALFSSDRPI
ncbi:MAG TPA: fibrillarin-like rRNA/tRNA 2'-O-methyltransferase [Nitrososphaeraceae archaeon]|jgi:fibrillarin-like pre-rRNA processing protein